MFSGVVTVAMKITTISGVGLSDQWAETGKLMMGSSHKDATFSSVRKDEPGFVRAT